MGTTLLKGRYEPTGVLGMNAACVTREARDQETGNLVVVKSFRMRSAGGWKEFEGLQAEAEALKALDHPRIPRFIDYFQEEAEGSPAFHLVMERIEGESLMALVERGWRGTEEEIAGILVQLLELLRYVHSLRPPLIHRDVSPNNVLRDPAGAVHLVDFSAVRDPFKAEGGATAIGTAGYAPAEQYMGRSSARSDLYGAAATTLFLLTHRNPAELPAKDLKPDLGGLGIVSARLRGVLDALLEPDPDKRLMGCEEAIAILKGEKVIDAPRSSPEPQRRRSLPALPAGSRLKVQDDGTTISIEIPPVIRARSVLMIPIAAVFSLFFLGVGPMASPMGMEWPSNRTFPEMGFPDLGFSVPGSGFPGTMMMGFMPIIPLALLAFAIVNGLVLPLRRRTRLLIKRGAGIRVENRRFAKDRALESPGGDPVPFAELSRCVLDQRLVQGGRTHNSFAPGFHSNRFSLASRCSISAGGRREIFGDDLDAQDKDYLVHVVNKAIDEGLGGGT